MASQTFNIDSFPKGYFMSWFVTTQAAFNISVTLKDSSGTYFTGSRASTNIAPPLAQGYSNINGSNLQLVVNIPQSPKIDSSINTYSITTTNGSIVGYGYNISIEDNGGNIDFNDSSISLVAWKYRG